MAIGGNELATAHRNAAITCGAMAASTVLYAVVVAVISVTQAPFEGIAGEGFAGRLEPSGLRVTLWTGAVLEAGLIGILRRTLLARSRSGGVSVQARQLVRTAVITSALAEVPAILGLALFMLSGLCGDFYALFALSIALQALYFPRLDGWREWADEPAPGC
jgi:F0F1-type ATP synthase membrane subunit c/vacuolar-type H+-ATPase subunit K